MLNLRDYLRFNTTLIFIDKFGSYPKYPLKRKHDKRSWNNVKRVKTMSNLTGKTVTSPAVYLNPSCSGSNNYSDTC